MAQFDPEQHEARAKLNSFRLARSDLFEECMSMQDEGHPKQISREQAIATFRHDLIGLAIERGLEKQDHILKSDQ